MVLVSTVALEVDAINLLKASSSLRSFSRMALMPSEPIGILPDAFSPALPGEEKTKCEASQRKGVEGLGDAGTPSIETSRPSPMGSLGRARVDRVLVLSVISLSLQQKLEKS